MADDFRQRAIDAVAEALNGRTQCTDDALTDAVAAVAFALIALIDRIDAL